MNDSLSSYEFLILRLANYNYTNFEYIDHFSMLKPELVGKY